jgi:photosystem II stability/assembly factor-like uncharacterized protein
MKKLLLLIPALFFITLSYAQWSDYYYSGLTYGRRVKILNSTTAILAGSYTTNFTSFTGKILRTTNGGTSFTTAFTGGYEIKGLYFWDANNGIAVGDNGDYTAFIGTTNNGGSSWTSTTSSLLLGSNVVLFLDNNTGFIGGDGGIIKTSNGGANWALTNGTTDNIRAISFPTSSLGYAVANNSFLKTTDGGDNWTDLTANLNYTYSLESMYFIDALVGFVIPFTGDMILKTIDGGQSWTQITLTGAGNLYDMKFISATTGYICGETSGGSIIMETTNAGDSWTTYHATNGVFSYYTMDIVGNFAIAAGLQGYSKTASFTTSGPSGINNGISPSDINIVNPSKNQFTISATENIKEVVLTNTLGQTEKFYSNEIKTNFKGLVMVHIKFENASATKKILIED